MLLLLKYQLPGTIYWFTIEDLMQPSFRHVFLTSFLFWDDFLDFWAVLPIEPVFSNVRITFLIIWKNGVVIFGNLHRKARWTKEVYLNSKKYFYKKYAFFDFKFFHYRYELDYKISIQTNSFFCPSKQGIAYDKAISKKKLFKFKESKK